MTPHSRICCHEAHTCLSLPARRLICRSVVVVHVRANRAIRWRANSATCWTNCSGPRMLQMHRIELCWTDRKSKFSPNLRRKLRNTNSRLIMTEEVYENSGKLLNLSKKNFSALKLKNFNDKMDRLLHLKKFQGSTFDTKARRRLVEDQDTILELTGKIQELQNEINCMNDPKDFQDAESIRSGNSQVTRQPVSFPLIQFLDECQAVLWECRAATMGRQAFGTHMVYWETFLKIRMRHHQHLVRRN